MHGPLNCSEGSSAASNSKSKELQVFLFEQTMILSEAVGKKTQFTNPVYIHKAHIQVRKIMYFLNILFTFLCFDFTKFFFYYFVA